MGRHALDTETLKMRVTSEMFAYVSEICEVSEGMLADYHAIRVVNEVHRLKSLVGQLESAARRYREMA